MNCKQGDLAMLRWSNEGNEGKVFRCLRLTKRIDWWGPNNESSFRDWTWETDTVFAGPGDEPTWVPDSQCRPIRDQPGQDEILRIAGRPQETVRESLKAIRELL